MLAHTERCRYPFLWDATHSVLFLATPHGGSKSADLAGLISNISSLAFQRPAKQLLDTLRLDSSTLYKLALDFRALPSEINIVSFYERRKTPVLNSLVGWAKHLTRAWLTEERWLTSSHRCSGSRMSD